VLSGEGVAIINGKRCSLRKNTLLVIRRGDRHEIRNSRVATLHTLNLYVSPAYTPEGTPLPRGKGG
jgi:mannose-6-phosphate isomerase-like protein (cupin superfamily)